MSQSALTTNRQFDEHRSSVRPIDLVHLARQSLGDPELEMEILTMYDGLLASHMAILSSSPSKTDVEHCLHALKGASAGVGARSIAEHATAFEKNFLETNDLDPEFLADLEVVVLETRAFIADLQPEHA